MMENLITNPSSNSFDGRFYLMLKTEITPVLHKVQRSKETILLNFMFYANIILITKSGKENIY